MGLFELVPSGLKRIEKSRVDGVMLVLLDMDGTSM